MLDRLSRFAPFTGFAFVVLLLLGIFSSKTSPNAQASGARVIAFYMAHKSGQETSDLLLGFAMMFFLCFIASLYGLLRRAEAAQTLALLGLIGAALFSAGLTLFAGIDYSLAYASHTLTPSAAQALNVIENQLFLPLFVGAVVFGVATGLAVVRSGLLPAWLGWAVLVFGIASGTPAIFIGGIGLMIWALVTSIMIYRRSVPSKAGGEMAAPA